MRLETAIVAVVVLGVLEVLEVVGADAAVDGVLFVDGEPELPHAASSSASVASTAALATARLGLDALAVRLERVM